jgi:GMP synthase (glutamine-hydrolysing)
MKIGILQTGHSPEGLMGSIGNYGQMFELMLDGHGLEFETFSVVDGIFPDGTEAADGWIITGSKHGAYEDHAWIPPLEELIRAIRAAGQPMAGICFGHQIIAQALGGKVEKFTGGWAVGRTRYDWQGKELVLNAWHQDQVVDLPEGAEILASNEHCKAAMLGYGDQIWTVQPHPEFSNEFIRGLIEQRGRGVVPDALLDAATEELSNPVDNPEIATFLVEFFKKERT